MTAKKGKKNKVPKNQVKKHGTRPYQKNTGGPSWDLNCEKAPDTEEMMALIVCREEDQSLYRVIFSKLANDPFMRNLSMTEIMDVAIMTMLQAKIAGWMLEIDDPERLEKMKESNKMLRSIIQIKNKILNDASYRAPIGGSFDGISKVLDEQEDEKDE